MITKGSRKKRAGVEIELKRLNVKGMKISPLYVIFH